MGPGQTWAPELGGRRWVPTVRHWPSQNLVFGSRGKGTESVHPVSTESTSAFFFQGRKTDSAPKFWSPGSNPGVYPASSSSRLGIALVVLNASLVTFRTMPMSLMYGILSPVHAGNSRTHALRHIDMDIVELCWYDSLSRTREQGQSWRAVSMLLTCVDNPMCERLSVCIEHQATNDLISTTKTCSRKPGRV